MIGPGSTVAGTLLPAGFALQSIAGLGGVSIIPRLISGVLGGLAQSIVGSQNKK